MRFRWRFVKDLDSERYTLVLDSQEVQAVLDSIGSKESFSSLLVWSEDGEYIEVWGIEYSVPHITDKAYWVVKSA